MAGPFALGETDTERGLDKGAREGTRLTMNADVAIPDRAAFIADPDHPGGLSGTIYFTPLGSGLASTHGVFNPFSPTTHRGPGRRRGRSRSPERRHLFSVAPYVTPGKN